MRTLENCKIIAHRYRPSTTNGFCDGVIVNGTLLTACASCKLHDANISRKTCELCGKEFFATTPQAKYCSEECRRVRRNSWRERKPKPPTRKSLDALLKEIDEYNATHGTHLTYGKYQAMKFREERAANEQRTNITNQITNNLR